MTIWLVEGLPGAGKSTLARHLCELANEAGYMARWYLEEDKDHPAHSATLRAHRNQGDVFAEACLDAWAAFVSGSDQGVLHILEGSAFQSTVRFMLEAGYSGIDDYFRRFEDILLPFVPRMIYLRATDSRAHSLHTVRIRGEEWSRKVSTYLERTHYSRERELTGVQGMHGFWHDYASLCDTLVANTRLRTCTLDFAPGDWSGHLPRAREFLFPRYAVAPLL